MGFSEAAELRSSLAELGKENAWAKSQWLSDISRWEAEKLALVADYEAWRRQSLRSKGAF